MLKILLFTVAFTFPVLLHAQLDSLEILAQHTDIEDTNAFWEGYNQGASYHILAHRTVGDYKHSSECRYHSYEKYGVKLEHTGDIINNPNIYDRNKGFNQAMQARFLDSIPQWVDSLGVIKVNWVEFDQELVTEFLKLLEIEKRSDSTFYVKLIEENIGLSPFKNLEGLEILNIASKTTYTYHQLTAGKVLASRRPNQFQWYLNFDACNMPIFICYYKAKFTCVY